MLIPSAIPVSASETTGKEEVIYIMSDAGGSVNGVYAVNIFGKGDVPLRRSTVRCVGVVVDKVANKDSAVIEVMFLGDTEGKQVYLTKKYIVSHSSGVFFDDNESYVAGKSIDLSDDVKIDFSQQARRDGGITISTGKKVNGGITLSKHAEKSSGGITISVKK